MWPLLRSQQTLVEAVLVSALLYDGSAPRSGVTRPVQARAFRQLLFARKVGRGAVCQGPARLPYGDASFAYGLPGNYRTTEQRERWAG